MRPVAEIAQDLGLSTDAIEPYGRYVAKVPLPAFPQSSKQGRLVVVTSMTPTPLGEGKTTTSIGLTDGLARLGKRVVLTVRQPSLGPIFGIKGGGSGGGQSRVEPEVDINVHFTGDAHAVASAHNLLAAMVDAAVHHRTLPDLDAERVSWRRVTNAEDRALRRVVAGMGGRANGPLSETGFDLDAASEIMAILALAKDYPDLRARLGKMVVGYTRDGKPVTPVDLKAVGAMMALLRNAMKPNLAQTREGNAALIHAGPFGNIAHGNSSVVADRLALSCADIVVTEAGFGADLGFEKFMHIKSRVGGVLPSAAVVVVTVRSLKWHGGVELKRLVEPDREALLRGVPNMQHALGIVQRFGVPAVVAINRRPDDPAEEVALVKQAALDAGAQAVEESHVYSEGGKGGEALAQAVFDATRQPSSPHYLYDLKDSVDQKVDALARQVYGADGARWDPGAWRDAQRFTDQGWGELPICMAKTHLSISADPKLRGRPQGYTFPITSLRVSAGAGFLYPLAGDIQTLPGLPKAPRALDIDVDDDGNVIGVT